MRLFVFETVRLVGSLVAARGMKHSRITTLSVAVRWSLRGIVSFGHRGSLLRWSCQGFVVFCNTLSLVRWSLRGFLAFQPLNVTCSLVPAEECGCFARPCEGHCIPSHTYTHSLVRWSLRGSMYFNSNIMWFAAPCAASWIGSSMILARCMVL